MSDINHTTEGYSKEAAHDHHDQFTILGRTFPFPVYTGVFILLAILTIIEVSLSRVPRGDLGHAMDFIGIIMLVLAVIKASLVVWFYMHLNKDSRIFLASLIIPTLLVIAAVMFLSIVPAGGY